MKILRKWMGLLLIVSMVLMTVGIALGGQKSKVNAYGWEVPEKPITITYYAGYGDQKEVDKLAAPLVEWYKKNFNVIIKKIVYPQDMNEKLNLMLAANNYPEVIAWMSDDMAEKFRMLGKALEITKLVDKYGSNIKRRLGKYLNLLKTDDGKLYKLPIGWGENPNPAGWDFAIRYDWWKPLKMKIYRTPEEYYNTLKAVVKAHPTNAKGQKVYALSDNSQGENLYGAMLGAYGFIQGFKVDKKTGKFTHWINTPEGLEIAKYINRFVREGLMDPDFLSNTFDTWKEKVVNERIAGNIGLWWHVWVAGNEAWGEMEKDKYNIEKTFMNVAVRAPGIKRGQDTLITSNFIGTARTIITDKCKQPENVMKWFNWECSELGTMITGHGYPDPNNIWNIVNGKWIVKDKALDYKNKNVNFHAVREKFGATQLWMVTSGGWLKDPRIDPKVTRVNTWDMWGINPDGSYKDPGVRIRWQYCDSIPYDVTLYTPVFKPEDPVTTINQTIRDTLKSEWAKIIKSKTEAECVQRFKEAQQKLNKLGLNKLEAFYKKTYDANYKKFYGKK